jgi:hypothetical protein
MPARPVPPATGVPFGSGRSRLNPIHTGQIAHKSELYPAQDPALIANETWAAVRDQRATVPPRVWKHRATRGPAGRG